MEIMPQIQAFFEAKAGNADMIADCCAENICIEDVGEDEVIVGLDNCKRWLEDKNRQYELKTRFIDVKNKEDETVKVSVTVSGNFAPGDYPFDYYFSMTEGKIKKVKIIYMGG
jgi:hypothetical protein